MRKEVDAVLYPVDNPFADDGMAPVGFGESSRKVGIDLSQVRDVDALFDDFDVG